MLIAYWIVAGLTALVFLAAGIMKATRAKDDLAKAGMTYVEDFTAGQIRLIGIAEALGAIGLILPMAFNIAPVLSPIAGIGIALIMIGAVVVHVRRKESFIPSLVLLLLAVASATLGFLALG